MKKKRLINLPFIHYKLELPELLQGVLMIAVGLSTIPVLQETLGLSYEAALTAVAIAEALGLLHVLFGDPVVPGWIASALSLVLVYLGGFAVGIESIHALMALQLILSVIFIVLGVTGLAHKLISIVPASLKAGILLGAAIAALSRVIGEGGYLSQYPLSVGSGSIVALFVLYSAISKKGKQRSRVYREITKYGMMSSLLVAMAVGFVSGELELPVIQWGLNPLNFGELFRTASVFAIGLPSAQTFINAIPVAFAVYIIAFGEIITSEAVLSECQEARPDEKLNVNSNKTNIITGVRNLILAIFCPFTALAGPLWAAVTVSIGERYKEGKESMKSLFGGLGSFKLSTALCVLILPLTGLLQPVLPVALAVTLVVQAYACSYIAIEQVKDDRSAAGTAGITGATVYIASLNWALVVGILSYILIEGGTFGIEFGAIKEKRKKPAAFHLEDLVVTVEQEAYSGGTAIAEKLAQLLDVPCYDQEILQRAAKMGNISLGVLQRYDGIPIKGAYDLEAENEGMLNLPTQGRMASAEMAAVKTLAVGGSCVIVDRFGRAALENEPHCISVYIHGDEDTRLERMMTEDNSASAAMLKKLDHQRRSFYHGTDKDWGNAAKYHICVDSSKMDEDQCAKQIYSYIMTVIKSQNVPAQVFSENKVQNA